MFTLILRFIDKQFVMESKFYHVVYESSVIDNFQLELVMEALQCYMKRLLRQQIPFHTNASSAFRVTPYFIFASFDAARILL